MIWRDILDAAELCESAYDDVPAVRMEGGGIDVQAVVRRGETTEIAFRGSTNRADWLANIKVVQTQPDGIPGMVHYGFWQQASAAYHRVLIALAADGGLDKPVRLYGHSKGLTEAVLTAAMLWRDGWRDLSVIGFGGPRVGSEEFSAWFDARIPHVRVEYGQDPVTYIPKWNARHTGRPLALGSWWSRMFFRRLSPCRRGDHDLDAAYLPAIREMDPEEEISFSS